jgi:hypothetical protein
MTLTIQEIKDKIAAVEKNLLELAEGSGGIQAISTLTSYKEYLEDELKNAEHARSNH